MSWKKMPFNKGTEQGNYNGNFKTNKLIIIILLQCHVYKKLERRGSRNGFTSC